MDGVTTITPLSVLRPYRGGRGVQPFAAPLLKAQPSLTGKRPVTRVTPQECYDANTSKGIPCGTAGANARLVLC
jgi:hypothetical protein